MFKFMKSKKGFSLVELMIVVVIMAILVAVAVPIFNSVTGNAREKTCIDNQRQIISSIGNLYMAEGISGKVGADAVVLEFSGTTIDFADGSATFEEFEGKTGEDKATVDLATVKGAFKTVPVCGDDTQIITATISPNTSGGTALVSTECSAEDDEGNKLHVLSTTAA